MRTARRASNRRREGFSLLEAILALAILTSSIAVLGELVRMGSQHAALARDLTQAQFLCESTMSEIATGTQAAMAVADAPIDPTLAGGDASWVYSVNVGALELPGLVAVQVTVRKNQPSNKRPASYTLLRWMKDPSVNLVPSDLLETESETSGATSGSGTSGSGTSSGSSGLGGSTGGASGR
jgi:type II secretory pathway pseudopilin PulG